MKYYRAKVAELPQYKDKNFAINEFIGQEVILTNIPKFMESGRPEEYKGYNYFIPEIRTVCQKSDFEYIKHISQKSVTDTVLLRELNKRLKRIYK